MKTPVIPLLTLVLFTTSCSFAARESMNAPAAVEVPKQNTQVAAETAPQTQASGKSFYDSSNQKVSLLEVDKAEVTNAATDRKIIRNADITIRAGRV